MQSEAKAHLVEIEKLKQMVTYNTKKRNETLLEIENLKTKLNHAHTEVEVHSDQIEKLKQKNTSLAKQRYESLLEIENLKVEVDNLTKAREETISTTSTLEYQLEQTNVSLKSAESDLALSKNRCDSLNDSLMESRNTMVSRLTDKACLQIDLSEKQVRLDLLRAENADLILKSSTELNKFEKEKHEIEARVLKLRSDLE